VKLAIEELARLPGVWRGGELEHAIHETVATGHAALDRELSGGGWPVGALSEVLHDGVGIGEVSFLCGALARAAKEARMIAWINPPHVPYAPALAKAGVPLERCTVVEPAHREDALWAAEQALRSGACGAVLLWLTHAMPREARTRADDYAWLRRLQMAAQAGRSMAVLFRSTAAESLSTPAHLRVVLRASGNGLELRIPKRRGPPLVSPIRLDLPGRARKAPVERSDFPDSAAVCAPIAIGPSRPLPRIAA
jgi:hypothetical protein